MDIEKGFMEMNRFTHLHLVSRHGYPTTIFVITFSSPLRKRTRGGGDESGKELIFCHDFNYHMPVELDKIVLTETFHTPCSSEIGPSLSSSGTLFLLPFMI